jgi:endopeptidase La
MAYDLRNKKRKINEKTNSNKKSKYDDSDDSDDESDIDTIYSTDIEEEVDSENLLDWNLDILNQEEIKNKLTKTIIERLKEDIKKKDIKNINEYLINLENKVKDSDFTKNENYKNNMLALSSIELSNKILKELILEIKYENKYNKISNLGDYLDNKLELLNEVYNLKNDKQDNNLIFKLLIDPINYLDEEEYETSSEDSQDKDDYDKEFEKFLSNGVSTSKNDLKYFKNLDKDEKEKYLKKINELKGINNVEKPKLLKIIESDINLLNKGIIVNKIQNFESLSPYSGEYFKLKNWVEGINKVPFGIYKKPVVSLSSSSKKDIKNYLDKVKNDMDSAVYGHDNAKKQILQVIAQTITKSNEGGSVIAIQGPPGVGKTQLIQDGISKALDRPFEFISLGGATDSAFLEGFDYTYEGSRWGKIVDCVINAKCMNPVIFFDELDKVSDTAKGEEIVNILMHLTDSTQNSHFNDKYFQGIDFDLSKCIFIFSFNEEWKINRILKDRMYIIRTDGFQLNEKIKIGKNYLIPKIINSVGYDVNNIIINDDIIKFIIENYTFEGGVRRLKECVLEICKEINLRRLNGTKLLEKKIRFPITLTKEMLTDDIFKKRRSMSITKIYEKPKVGLVNGLWANDMGVGGLIPIEVFSIPTNNKLELQLTGQLGDVMKESMRCAKTVAWNVLPDKYKEKLNKEWKDFGNTGIHIHCPDGATPKDGPSAGAGITTAIISLLMNVPVNNKFAMTGEINLKGEVTEIGGLCEKLNGAKKAGVETVLIPNQNKSDLEKIKNGDNNPIDKNFNVLLVNNIWDVINYIFNKNVKIKKY